MKKLILFLFLSSLTVGCSDDDKKEENILVGKWKLTHTNSFGGNFYKLSTNENVVYHFKEDKNLTIESNISKDSGFDKLPEDFVTPKTIPYSFHYDGTLFYDNVVRIGNETNSSLGEYYFKIQNDSLSLHEYDGRSLFFKKIK